jgi:hypothetical protein
MLTKKSISLLDKVPQWRNANGRWHYAVLFGMQTIGAIILFWNAIPVYQQILADPASHEARPENLVWSLSSVVLMQIGYWTSYRDRPLPTQFRNALLGHLILFVARMSFVFPTSVFGFLFIAQNSAFHIPVFRYVVALLGLFSLYCYTRELERLGAAFLGR